MNDIIDIMNTYVACLAMLDARTRETGQRRMHYCIIQPLTGQGWRVCRTEVFHKYLHDADRITFFDYYGKEYEFSSCV